MAEEPTGRRRVIASDANGEMGRINNCGITAMPHNSQLRPRRCIRTLSYVNPVNPPEDPLDTENRHTALYFLSCVKASTLISRTTKLENVRNRNSSIRILKKMKSGLTGRHSLVNRIAVLRKSASRGSSGGLTGLTRIQEVIL